jgi:hypothetical protein
LLIEYFNQYGLLSGDFLEVSYIPAYTTSGLNGTRLLGGVNYASAGGGILDETGQHLVLSIVLSLTHIYTDC